MDIKKISEDLKDYTILLRREFHMNPEASMKEYETSKRIKQELGKYNISYESVGETGVLATIKGDHDGAVVALRADMDALELEDKKQVPYKSKNIGLCHGCGHDGHTAMLLTASRILNDNKDKIKGTVKLVFQPAEESIVGAKMMMENNNFMDTVDSILGIHLMSDIAVGTIGCRRGAISSSADMFKIFVQGKGGHGSMPHQTVDALLISSAIAVNAQSIVSRELDPGSFGVITIGTINAGSRFNIIADSGELEGTIRSYDENSRKIMCDGLKRIAEETAKAYKGTAKVEFPLGTPSVINVHTDFLFRSAEKIVGKEKAIECEPLAGSEDFSYYLEKGKGVFALVGCRNEEKGINKPHHHPMFDIDEDALPIGTAIYVQYALDFLNEYSKTNI